MPNFQKGTNQIILVIGLIFFIIFWKVEPFISQNVSKGAFWVTIFLHISAIMFVGYCVRRFAPPFVDVAKQGKFKKAVNIGIFFSLLLFLLNTFWFNNHAAYDAQQNAIKPIKNLVKIGLECGLSDFAAESIIDQAEERFDNSAAGKEWGDANAWGDEESSNAQDPVFVAKHQTALSIVIYTLKIEAQTDRTYKMAELNYINDPPNVSDDDFKNAYVKAFFSCDGATSALQLAGYDVK